MHRLNFQPLPGLASSHLQTIIASYFPAGEAPPSTDWLVRLEDGDCMSCLVSTPPLWKNTDETIVMIHGMGGCDSSTYMVRISRKFYQRGYRVVRVNLRGAGGGEKLAKRPYHGGSSNDIQDLTAQNSNITVIGFSLGGNIVLKLAGELGTRASALVKHFIAICPPINLAKSVESIQEGRNWLYHSYYLRKISEQAQVWLPKNVDNLHEFDELVTAPLWGYKNASDYYSQCSGARFLPEIQQSTHILFAEDDPFVPIEGIDEINISKDVHIWSAKQGGHMGFLGKATKVNSPFWMDHMLLNWMEGDFASDCQVVGSLSD
jgi:predicted alpha/beta-fold hydrolase